MLSERERRTLAEIEQRILGDGPWFAASMQKHVLRGRNDRWARRGYDAIIGLGAATAALCFGLLLFGTGTVAVLAVAATCYLRRTRFPPRSSRRAGRPWRR